VKGFTTIVILGTVVASGATPASAQTAASARVAAEQRYQVGQMERLLEGAVEHGIAIIRDHLQSLAQMPADMLLSDNAHARGFRLEGYGVFFDVVVPSFETSWTIALRTLDQSDLGLDSALKTLQALVRQSGDANVQQALKRVELQVNPGVVTRTLAPDAAGARNARGASASVETDPPLAGAAADPILADPNEAYHTEVIQALKDAMLTHSRSLGIGANEWLTIAAKGNEDRPRLAPADSDARTRILRLRGADLAAFLAGQITHEEALERIEVLIL
jgi:hypothetical protein